MTNPGDLKFSKSHEWVKIEEEIGWVGITDFAVQQLSDLVFIDLPKVGQEVKQGEPFGEVESVKTVVELSAPVSGEVVEVNEPLTTNLDLVTKEPYGGGWMIKIKLANPDELKNLLSKADYDKLCESEHE